MIPRRAPAAIPPGTRRASAGLGTDFDSDATTPAPPAVGPRAAAFPRFGRVAVLVLENREYHDVIGGRNAPYLTRLPVRHALATRYYALGHPPLPNYLALTSGTTLDVRQDCND